MSNVLDLQAIDATMAAIAGGKGAHLGELSRIKGIRVPPGFCVTTRAFQRIFAEASTCADRLSSLQIDDRESTRALSAETRQTIEAITVPDDVAAEITRSLERLGAGTACAVRSSATAEDLPTASFAGQQDTYLNVVGSAAVLERVSQCWASLFTERAVTYRLRNGFDHRSVQMAVVVQQMVLPQVSGILFTADPVTGNRRVSTIEATFGLGEALVSGLVNADVYKVRGGELVEKTIGAKSIAIIASPRGGTREQTVAAELRGLPALTDTQIVHLAELGRRIEAHIGRPQDIEWCLADDDFQFVQSRPISTLFPIPAAGDEENHVYVSVGHQQMMTDPMKPLGISLRQLTVPMHEAAGRLFVDVTPRLASPRSRAELLDLFGRSDPLLRDALQTILDRGDFIRPHSDEPPRPVWASVASPPIATDPAIAAGLIARNEESIATAKRDIRTKTGSALMDFILEDMQELKRILFVPESMAAILTGMDSTQWLNEHLEEWLGEKNAADVLSQSVDNNVSSEMGLSLLDVADAIRPQPDVVAFLRQVKGDDFLNELPTLAGGRHAHDAIVDWLDKYGMRGAGEIDITRPRWSERPTMILPILLAHIDNFDAGERKRRFERGRQAAWKKEQELLARLRALPDGESKAVETKRMIDRVRTFIGYREYPKYAMVHRSFVHKQALLEEAERLVEAGALREKEDIFYLGFEELADVVRTHQVDDHLIRQRKDAFRTYGALTPPRVLTSEGEAISGVYRRDDLPAGALAGTPVSAGTVEGRARVILDMSKADLAPGDILVTTYTDPSWTPLFVAITGLVTEVGGIMTHGAVIAREYGLPAIVGVAHATRLIRDGARIRVHGTEGYVEILSDADGRQLTAANE